MIFRFSYELKPAELESPQGIGKKKYNIHFRVPHKIMLHYIITKVKNE